MSDDKLETHSRRDFLTEAMLAGGAAAVLATASVESAAAAETSSAAVNAMLPTPAQMQEFLALPDDHPIVMVNLLKFKPGGAAEYAKYAAGIQPILQKIGAKILFAGKAEYCLIGKGDWDMVALVQYPRKKSLLQMSMSPEYRAIHPHREKGLAGQINYAVVQVPATPESLSGAGAGGDEARPGVFRTPDERFANLPGFDFKPHYKDVGGYRMHYLDEGPAGGQPVLLLHGEPTWCYLYRKMFPVLTAAGYRCVVPDLIGFGRSDKPADRDVYTYKFHVDQIAQLIEALGLKNCTLFGQDWGGLIGLRVAAENEDRFARIVISNTGLPTGEEPMTTGFLTWKAMATQMLNSGDMPVGTLVATSARMPGLKDAYDAPFPDKRFKAGALMFPQIVPASPNDPAKEANKRAWAKLREWKKPFLTAFGDHDPITGGGEKKFQKEVPGAQGQPHTTIKGAGHFIQESHGPELAAVIAEFIAKTPSAS